MRTFCGKTSKFLLKIPPKNSATFIPPKAENPISKVLADAPLPGYTNIHIPASSPEIMRFLLSPPKEIRRKKTRQIFINLTTTDFLKKKVCCATIQG